jgi:hypothetical protein
MAEMSAERLLMSAADSMGNRSIGPVAKELRALAERAGLTQDQAAAGLADGSIKSTNKTMMNAIRGAITSAVNYTADALTIPEQYIPPELRGKGKQLADIAAAVSPGVDFQDMIKGSANMMNAQTPGEAAKGGAEMLIGMAGQAPGFGDAFALAAKGALPAIFAGVGAKTMDAAKYARAEDMHRAGASRDDIWNETGWFKGGDGNWRFEIDDSASMADYKSAFDDYDPKVTEMGEVYRNMPSNEIASHPDLFGAYPSIGETEVVIRDSLGGRGMTGGYAEASDRIHLSDDIPTDAAARGTLLHEFQHGVQAREGFARGGNTSFSTAELTRINDELGVASKEIDNAKSSLFGPDRAAALKPIEARYDSLLSERSALISPAARRDTYNRLAGEVEARNVQTRQNMNALQRQATPPWQTQDVPDSAQVFRTGNRGPQGSQSLLDYLAQQKMTAEY